MRMAFHQQLDALTHNIADMCGLAGTAMQQATQALLHADIVLAEIVISDDNNLAALCTQVESGAGTANLAPLPHAGLKPALAWTIIQPEWSRRAAGICTRHPPSQPNTAASNMASYQ
jgi:hypothetical protein